MPRKRKRSVSPPTNSVGPAVRSGGGMEEGRNDISIQQDFGSISQSGRSNPRSHSSIHERDAMISPRQHQHHSPPHYQPPPAYEQQQQQQRNHAAYSPPPLNTNTQHSSYHHSNSNQTHRNSPDREEHTLHSPSNPHAPSHYNFANRAYAQQRDSGFNTFRVNPGPVAGGNSNSVPPVPPPIASSPLPTPSSDHHHPPHHEDSFQYRYRSHSHSQPPPAAAASTSIPPASSYARLSPPLEIVNANANGSGFRNNRNWGRNGGGGGEISLSSSDEDDVPYNPVTAGGRSKAMVKYLIMKAKYRYVLDERALLADELESLRREEHEQWTLKEVGVDEIIKSFGSDSDRFLHDRSNDQHAQQYQLHHDHDSADGDMDLLRDLDKERHAFLNNRDRGRERKEHVRDVGNDAVRGRDHHYVRSADLDRNGNEASRDNGPSGGRQRQRSSSRSRSRMESNLDSHSSYHHHPRHSYRRTPPLSSISERHHPSQQASSSSFSQQDARPYVPDSAGDGFGQQQDGGQRYLSSPHQQQQQYPSHAHGGRGLISPPSSQQRRNRYQSPPPPLPLPPQHRTPPPPHQYSRESSERRRNHEESFQPPGEPRDGGGQGQGSVYGSNNTFPVNDGQHQRGISAERGVGTMGGNIPSSSSSRPPRHSPRISHSSHSPDTDPNNNRPHSSSSRLYLRESSRERERELIESNTRPKRGRPSLEDSVRERDYENNSMDGRGSTSIQTTTDPVRFEAGRQYSPSRRSPPPSERSVTPQPATPKQTQTQTQTQQKDPMEMTSGLDSARSRSRTSSSAASLSHPTTQLQNPPSNFTTQSSRSAQVGGSPPLRTLSLAAATVSSTPIRNTTPPPLSNSHTATAPINDSPPPPHRPAQAVYSPLTLQQKDAVTNIIKDERDLQVEDRESNNDSGRRGNGVDMDVD